MQILLVNRFFGPDASPTGALLHDLAEQLHLRGATLHVLCSPNSYHATPAALPMTKTRFSIHTTFTVEGLPRLLQWIFFFVQALIRVPFLPWDRCVILTDQPFLGLAGVLGKSLSRNRQLCLWTMDLYPEALFASGKIRPTSLPGRLLNHLAFLLLNSSDKVIALGQHQLERLHPPAPVRTLVVPPWNKLKPASSTPARNPFVLLYSGNLGEAHLFEEIISTARYLHDQKMDRWLFQFQVRGTRVEELRHAAGELPNVKIAGPSAREVFETGMAQATVHLVTLRPGWEGIVVPSKIFAALETEAPILFIGPEHSDPADTVFQQQAGICLPPGAEPEKVVAALEELAQPRHRRIRGAAQDGAAKIAEFILS